MDQICIDTAMVWWEEMLVCLEMDSDIFGVDFTNINKELMA